MTMGPGIGCVLRKDWRLRKGEAEEKKMSTHEITEGSDNWYTPKWIMDKLDYEFSLDPCAGEGDFVRSKNKFYKKGLERFWLSSVWLNPPFGDTRYQIEPWLKKFILHAEGISIVPNRTATSWWQEWAEGCDYLVFLEGKVKFIKDGQEGKSPGYGNVLGAVGNSVEILREANFRGFVVDK